MTDDDSSTTQLLIRLRILIRLKPGKRDENRDEVQRTLLEIIRVLFQERFIDEAQSISLRREHLDEALETLLRQEHKDEARDQVINETIQVLHTRYAPQFYRYTQEHVRRSGLTRYAEQITEDAMQDTFEYLLRNIERFDENRGSGEAWIWLIFKSRMKDTLRRIRPAEQLPDDEIFAEADGEDPVAYDEQRELLEALNWAWNHHSPEAQEAIRSPGRRGPRSRRWYGAGARLRVLMFYVLFLGEVGRNESLPILDCVWMNLPEEKRKIVELCPPASQEWQEAAEQLCIPFLRRYHQEH